MTKMSGATALKGVSGEMSGILCIMAEMRK
jgi:hypothetical protein